MSEDLVTYEPAMPARGGLPRCATRAQILALEAAILAHPDSCPPGQLYMCPLTHRFGEGLYVREMFIPAGLILTGKIHKHLHPLFVLRGALYIASPGVPTVYVEGPWTCLSAPGTKRVGWTLTDVVLVTVHATTCTDVEQIEADMTAESFEAYDAWQVARLGLPPGTKEDTWLLD